MLGEIKSAWFVGSPAAAEELGLEGDQYMGWTGNFEPGEFSDIQVEETQRPATFG